jgi:RNA polymerase sigma-70 factor, ECF subfamily
LGVSGEAATVGSKIRAKLDPARQRQVVDAFLAASRGGDMSALLAVLDSDVVLRADPAAVRMGGTEEVRGAAAVAATFKGRAQAARPALVDGAVGLTVLLQGQLRVVLGLTIAEGKIIAIDAIADPEHLRRLDISVLDLAPPSPPELSERRQIRP